MTIDIDIANGLVDYLNAKGFIGFYKSPDAIKRAIRNYYMEVD